MKYLLKYRGKYRILAHYDLETNDFIRDIAGSIDLSFDDYYIPCKGKSQIYHYGQDTLIAYIPSTQQGKNIVEKLNGIDPRIILEFEKCDGECEFKFNSEYIDIVAGTMGARTSGANIPPLSPKNLPKQKYLIPKADLADYKHLIRHVELKDIKRVFSDFDKFIIKYMKIKTGDKDFDIFSDK